MFCVCSVTFCVIGNGLLSYYCVYLLSSHVVFILVLVNGAKLISLLDVHISTAVVYIHVVILSEVAVVVIMLPL